MKANIKAVIAVAVISVLLVIAILSKPEVGHDSHGHEHGDHNQEYTKGPHGGRLLVQNDFALEVTIYDTGLPPEFRVYAYHDDQTIDAEKVTLDIELTRIGNRKDPIRFSPAQGYLRGDAVVVEPHSFEVSVSAEYQGKAYAWHYDNFEGRTQIPADIADEMNIQTEAAGPVVLTETRTLTGRVQTDPNRLARVRPRFPGLVNAVNHELGDTVASGDVLATVQSNESLQEYAVEAPISGLIIKRDLQLGEATGEEPLFIIVDLSQLWVELDVFARDLDQIHAGMPVKIETLGGGYRIAGSIDWISPLTAHASQSVKARVVIVNEGGQLRPGQFVRGHVTVAEAEVPLAVRQSAVQRFRDFQVVFERFDDVYEVRMLELGRHNRDWVEVLGGIEAGAQYVTENSYLIKADIEKSGASHDH